MKEQGVVEYVAVLLLLVLTVIFMLVLLGPTIGNVFQNGYSCTSTSQVFVCRDQRFDECMALEKYTADQCVRMVSGGG